MGVHATRPNQLVEEQGVSRTTGKIGETKPQGLVLGPQSQEKRFTAVLPWLFAATILSISFLGINSLPIVGEEPRRGQVAREMYWAGDWLVPREQGQLYCTRPPLQNWLIGAIGVCRGKFDVFTVRLPSALALVLASVICWRIASKQIGPVAGIVAGMAYLTMGQSLTIGQLGETDSLFAAFLGGALLMWFSGQNKSDGKSNWISAGFFAGLAALTKGLQAPVYFILSTTGFLWISGQQRRIVSKEYLASVGAMVLPIALWSIPYCLTAGLPATREIWFGQVEERLATRGLIAHFISFPVATIGAMLPWSWLFLAWTDKSFRRWATRHRSLITYMTLCVTVGFASLWVVPEAKNRYLLPLYLPTALILSLPWEYVAETVNDSKNSPYMLPKVLVIFLRLLQALAVLGSAAAILLCVPKFFPISAYEFKGIQLSPLPTIVICFLAILMIVSTRLTLKKATRSNLAFSALAIGLFLGLGHRVGILSVQRQLLWSPGEQIQGLASEIRAPEKLVSVGPVSAAFRFHYPYFVRQLPRETTVEGLPNSVFCLSGTMYSSQARVIRKSGQQLVQFPLSGRLIVCPQLSFCWKPWKVIPLGRTPTRDPQPVVVVGEALPKAETEPSSNVAPARALGTDRGSHP
ncbi:glycosyltransferase family 39 protein [Thermogutta sp.]|uniref:ArnT family glycosyltransferase n=1 Tax=Thermogutta sp. TaxID=1962930 RepID=UPI003220990B